MATGPPTLVGREPERAEALRALTRAPGSVVLHGPAGIGKTHLATAVAAAVDQHRCTVTRVVGTSAAVSIPLGALAHLLPPLPDGTATDAATDLTLLRHGIEALPRLAPSGDLLLVVDDAQYLDPTSALVIQQLGVSRTVKLLLTVRSTDPVPDAVASLWTNGDAHRLDLHELDEDGVATLLGETLGAPVEGATARRITQLSEGNPLFALELAAATRREGWLGERDGIWRLREGWQPAAGPGRLSDLLASRLQALGPAGQEGLELLALAEVLTLADADALIGPGRTEELEEAGLVAVSRRGGRDELRLRHPLLGELVRRGIPTSRRRRLHGVLAAEVPVDPGASEAMMRRALWLLESGAEDPGLYAWAARFARFANDHATGLRFAEAAFAATDDVECAVLAGEMAYQAGDYGSSHEWLVRASALAVTDEELALVVINHLSTVYWGLRDWGAVEALTADFRHRHPDSPWVDDIEGLVASLVTFSGRPRESLERVAPLRRRDDLRAKVELAFVESGALACVGATDRSVARATEGFQHHVALGEQVGLGSSAAHMLTSLAALSAGGRLDAAEAMGATLYDAITEAPNAFALALVTLANGRTALARGRPQTAERWFREGAAVSRDTTGGDQLRWCLGGVALALAVTGRTSEAAAVAGEARRIDGLARLNDIDLELAEAWIRVGGGDVRGAVTDLLAAAERWAAVGFVVNEARALHATVSLDAGDAAAERLGALAAEADSDLVRLPARHAAAVAARSADDLEDAADGYEAIGARFWAAEALVQAARLVRLDAGARRAGRLERRARALVEGCEGAVNPVLFVEEESVPLTNREREVALLAARGMSSRDIADQLSVSVRTVDNHLHRAYTKLRVADRSELAQAFGVED